ncbi:hypothetical protein M9458_002875, partial [Cirrhinus mrigala]
KVPPPKPKRNPNTQLSTSFDESYIRSHGSKGSPTMLFSSDGQAPSPPQPQGQQDSDLDEPVYIEMSGNVGREPTLHPEEDEPGEAVYEEMKYPALDEFDLRWDLSMCRSQCATPCTPEFDIQVPLNRCTTPRGTPFCDIPAPFPNLLTHRPPLLVFPPAPAQCSPNSDDKASYVREWFLWQVTNLFFSGTLWLCIYTTPKTHSYNNSIWAIVGTTTAFAATQPAPHLLMRSPPFDGPFSTAGLPRSASATPHGKGSPPQDAGSGGRHHGSMQNVSVARSRTPTSPLDELTNLFTTGRNMLKKNTSGRKSKEPGES